MARRAFRSGPCFLAAVLIICVGCRSLDPPGIGRSDESGIRQSLESLNQVCAARDVAGFMALFDDSDAILFIGSDRGEVFAGRDAIAGFMKTLFGLPFVFSFDLSKPVIRRDGAFAWVFVDGAMSHIREDGKTSVMPYRFSIAMRKEAGAWRWTLFHGSVPGSE